MTMFKCFFKGHDWKLIKVPAGRVTSGDGYMSIAVTEGFYDGVCKRCNKTRQGFLPSLKEINNNKETK